MAQPKSWLTHPSRIWPDPAVRLLSSSPSPETAPGTLADRHVEWRRAGEGAQKQLCFLALLPCWEHAGSIYIRETNESENAERAIKQRGSLTSSFWTDRHAEQLEQQWEMSDLQPFHLSSVKSFESETMGGNFFLFLQCCPLFPPAGAGSCHPGVTPHSSMLCHPVPCVLQLWLGDRPTPWAASGSAAVGIQQQEAHGFLSSPDGERCSELESEEQKCHPSLCLHFPPCPSPRCSWENQTTPRFSVPRMIQAHPSPEKQDLALPLHQFQEKLCP